jgi:hypothetical protein
MSESPKGKLPYVKLGTGELLSDSTLVVRRLEEEGAIASLNNNLSSKEKAQDLAIRALLEDKLFFMTVRCTNPAFDYKD